jgi:hemolysin III
MNISPDMMRAGSDEPNPEKRTRSEFAADMLIHFGGLTAALSGATILLFIAAGHGRAALLACGVYVVGLVAMLACSTAYNWAAYSGRWAEWLQRFDQSAIFLMIAGSYTPFTALHLSGAWAIGLTAFVWSVAWLGIGLRFGAPRVFQSSALVLYLGLGWVGLVALGPLHQALSGLVFALLVLSGTLFTAGVIFYAWQELPFRKAIWHAFVLAGASVHFAAVTSSLAALRESLA